MAINNKTADMDVEQSVDEKNVLSQHVDKAAKFLVEADAYPPLSPEAERKLLRKVDWIMIPIVSSFTIPLPLYNECLQYQYSYSSLLRWVPLTKWRLEPQRSMDCEPTPI